MRFISKGKFSKIKTLDTPIYVDTETSWNHDPDEPITWIVSIQVCFNGKTYFFRRPMEFIEFLSGIVQTYNINTERRILIVIHNQSYDLSYLLPYIQLYLPYKDERSCILSDSNKIVNYRQGGLDFRCSYILTQKSLEKLGEQFNVAHKKKVGLYDYDSIHFQDDNFTQNEIDYAIYDVISLAECFDAQMKLHGDNTATVPLTHTGYIRRKLRLSCRKDRYYRERYFTKTKLNADSYLFCRGAYSGGYTHNNRNMRERVIKPSDYGMKYLKHRDFRSHYPTQMRIHDQPLGKPQIYYDITDASSRLLNPDISIDEILSLSPRFTTITALAINKCTLKDKNFPMPIMQKSKLHFEENEVHLFKVWADNGRVRTITCKDPNKYCILYVFNQTLELLQKQYNIDGIICKVYRIQNKPLPKCISDVIDDLFRSKSDLKYKVKECEEKFGTFAEETYNAKAELMLSKSLLNAIYGCCCFDPVRDNYDIDYEKNDPVFVTNRTDTPEEIQKALDDYYKSRNNFLPYPLGCAITEWAKYELFEYAEIIGFENILYCDTDSIFYLSNDEIEKRVEVLNAKKQKTAPYVVDSKGKRIYYNVFEEEPDLLAFKGLHSKCYGVVAKDKNGDPELQLTVAGVPAKTLIKMVKGKHVYLTREAEISKRCKDPFRALDRLEDNFTFHVNTGTTCKYTTHKPEIIEIDGHIIETAGGAIIQRLTGKQVKNMDLDETVDFTPIDGGLC